MNQAQNGGRILTEHRSYDADEVDAFLSRVRAGVARLKKERQAAIDRAVVAERRDEERATALGRRIVNMQQALDIALAGARREADDLISEAQARADRILAAAEAKAQVVANDAEHSRPLPAAATAAATTRPVATGSNGYDQPWTFHPPATDGSGDDFFTELGRSLEAGGDANGAPDTVGTTGGVMSDTRCRSCAGKRPDRQGLCRWCGGTPDEVALDAHPVLGPIRRAVQRPRAPVAAVGLGSLLPRRR